MVVDIPSGILKQSDVRETITNTEEAGVGFNVDYARFNTKLDMSAGALTGVYVNPEGTELFVCGVDDDVDQFTMSTRWDLSTATLTNSLDLSARDTILTGIYFKYDGTKMYLLGDQNDKIYEYNLSVAWDLSSAAYLQEIATNKTSVDGLFFREDGKQLYFGFQQAPQGIRSFHLSTPWDVSTAVALDVFTYTDPGGLGFNRAGTIVVFVDRTNNYCKTYTLTSPFRISTATDGATFTPFPAVADLEGLCFSPTGSLMYLTDGVYVLEYSIKRGWR